MRYELEKDYPELKESEDERIRKELINYFIKGKEYLSLCSFSKEEILAWLEKQQKPANVEEPNFFDDFRNSDVEVDSNEDGLIAETIKYKNEQNLVWSEEDEKIYQSIMDDTVQENQLDGKQTDWLRGIKYRYFLQSKQEWSEKDEHWRQKAIDFMKHPDLIKATPTLAKDTISWLESLRPQNRWKPSDEQMIVLQEAIGIVG